MRLLPLLLLAAALAPAQDTLAVPAFRVDLLPGGRANVVVDNKAYPMDLAKANALKAQLDALDHSALRSDLSKLRTLEREAAEAEKDMETRVKAVERETERAKQAERQVASLEKRQDQLEEQLRRDQRNKQDNVEDLRRQINNLNAAIGQERKDLSRCRENLARAQANRKETDAAQKSAQGQASGLRQSVSDRIEKARALLAKELGA